MKCLLRSLCVCLLLSTAAVAKDKPVNDLQGSWKSVSITGPGKRQQPIVDTILLQFKSATEYTWVKGQMGIPLHGNYSVNKNNVDLGMTQMQIKQIDAQQMTVQIEDEQYTFVRYQPGTVREDNSNASSGDRLRQTEVYKGITDFSLLSGKWRIYKCDRFVKGGDVAYSRIVRLLDIPAAPAADKKGWIYAASDGADAPSWYIEKMENSALYCKGKSEQVFKVLKCDGAELVFEDESYRYYCKHFNP